VSVVRTEGQVSRRSADSSVAFKLPVVFWGDPPLGEVFVRNRSVQPRKPTAGPPPPTPVRTISPRRIHRKPPLPPASIAPATAATVTVRSDSQETHFVSKQSLPLGISNARAWLKAAAHNYEDDSNATCARRRAPPDRFGATQRLALFCVLDENAVARSGNGGLVINLAPPAVPSAASPGRLVDFTGSDGPGITKHCRFDHTYVVPA